MDGKDKVLQQFDVYGKQKPHWKMYYGSEPLQGNLCGSTEVTVGQLDATSSRKLLSDTLDLLDPGDYLVQFKDVPTANKNIINTRFTIKPIWANQQQPASTVTGIGAYNGAQGIQELIKTSIGAATAEMKLAYAERENKELLKELREAKSKNSGNSLVEIGKQLLDAWNIAKGMAVTQGPAVITGTQQPRTHTQQPAVNAVNTNADEWPQNARNVFDTVFREWAASIAPGNEGQIECIKLIYAINEYRKANPAIYTTLVGQIEPYAKTLTDET